MQLGARGKPQTQRLRAQARPRENAYNDIFLGLVFISLMFLLQHLPNKVGLFVVAGSVTGPSPREQKCRWKHLHLVCLQTKRTSFVSTLLFIFAWCGLSNSSFSSPPSSSDVHGAPRISWALCCVQTFQLELGKKTLKAAQLLYSAFVICSVVKTNILNAPSNVNYSILPYLSFYYRFCCV